MKRIETFAEALEFLGTPADIAKWLQISENHVGTMKSRGRAPRGFILHFYLTLRERGVDPAPAVFGLKSFKSIIMPQLKRRVSKDTPRDARQYRASRDRVAA